MTKDEIDIIRKLEEALYAYTHRLPSESMTDKSDFHNAILKAQELVYARVGKRVYKKALKE